MRACGAGRSEFIALERFSFLRSADKERELADSGVPMFFPLAAKRARAPAPMVVLTRGFLLLCLALLMSCGGGGGDNGGGDPFRITLERSSISWTFLEGTDVLANIIRATASGDYDGPLFVAAIIENDGAVNAIDPGITISISGNQATAAVLPVGGLAVGTYTGRILFLACSDAACNNRIGGTPLPVGFTVTVQPGVRATPGAITRTIETGNTVVEDLAVTPGTGETSFVIGEPGPGGAFVEITNETAAGFRVTLAALPAGVYTATISLLGSSGSHAGIPITYTVTPPPGGEHGLSVSPGNVTLTTTESATSQEQQVQVTQPSWRPGLQTPFVHYLEGQFEGWLHITPAAGGYSFVADATNLQSGSYNAIVSIGSNPLPQGIAEPFQSGQQVSVALTVGQGLVRPADVMHVVDSESAAGSLTGTVDIDLVAGPPLTWSAIPDVPWLTVTPSGVTGSAMTYSIDPTWLSTAANFTEHVANVAIIPSTNVVSSTSFAVRVQRRLAEVTGVGAHIQATGQPTKLVVSGRGFAAVTNPAARLIATGAAATSVQRVSDTKLLVSFTSLSAGEHVVRVNNALGFATATRSTIAVTPTSYAYDTVDSDGRVIYLAVDHETDTLYGVRLGVHDTLDQGTLVRFRPSGGNWVADSPSIAAVDNVGVLLDGNVIVSTQPGGLTILDRDTMNPTFTLDLGCTGFHFRSENMPVTLDGRVWLSQARINGPDCSGSPLWGEVGFFDPASQIFQLFEAPNQPWFAGSRFANGPSFIMSRNGERLVMHQESNQNFPPLVYLDASESVLRPGPADGDIDRFNFQTASLSDDGSRILFEKDRLVNEQFAAIGRVSIPAYASPFVDPALPAAAVLSPDGSRAYVLTYPGSFLAQVPTPATPLPRVWVLDTSGDVGDAPVPVLGYFELADYPSCLHGVDNGCDYKARAAISLYGHTLFIVGDERLVVTPIPPEGTLNDSIAGPGSGQQRKAVPWHLPGH